MRLLLISNSTNVGESYLEHARDKLKDFLNINYCNILFIPYAGVTISYTDYSLKVNALFREIGFFVDSIDKFRNPSEAVKNAKVIMVGGGNTFQLLKLIYDNKLLALIREKIISGTPYIGWSAGANIACPSIRTTNDMPVVQPESLNSLNLIPFQINPHFLDFHPEGHAGETREARIKEFIELNREIYVVGLREGTMLKIEDQKINLLGRRSARIFRYGMEPVEIKPGEDLTYLLRPVK